MKKQQRVKRKPYFFMWIVIGIGVGASIGGGIFGSFVLGAGLGVGFGVLLGLWTERIYRKNNAKQDEGSSTENS